VERRAVSVVTLRPVGEYCAKIRRSFRRERRRDSISRVKFASRTVMRGTEHLHGHHTGVTPAQSVASSCFTEHDDVTTMPRDPADDSSRC